MTRRPDEHVLSVEEGKLSPVIVVVTGILVALFLLAFAYRLGIALL